MIVNTTYKKEAFINVIARHFGRGNAAFSDLDTVWYFGGGYWRGQPVEYTYKGFTLPGIRLVNPDVSQADIQKAEQGIAVIEHLEYRENEEAG